jgi:hypothetical protein
MNSLALVRDWPQLGRPWMTPTGSFRPIADIKAFMPAMMLVIEKRAEDDVLEAAMEAGDA